MQTNIIITDQSYNGLNPMQFGYHNCPPSHAFGPAIRTHWLIHFVISGRGVYETGGKTFRVGAGEMFVIPPYEETFYMADQADPWSYIWIGFTSSSPLPVELDYVIRYPEAQRIFTKMKECSRLEGGRSAYLSARLWDLFALLLDNKSPQPNYIDKALDCIHSEYMHGITIDEIANRLSLNRMYFSKLFKQNMGVSPKQYLFNYRMNIAATLLNRQVSVSVAASSVGYSDVFNFSKMFKRHFGMSPSQYAASNQI